jgi:hypothetical protein
MNKFLFCLSILTICFDFYSQSNLVWEGNGNNGKKTTFTKINDVDWIENDEVDSYYYSLVKVENNGYMLSDKFRQGVYIYLNSNECFYKDNNTDWILIYNGAWKTTTPKVKNSSNNITSSQSQNFIPENCESARKEYLDKNPDVKNVGMDPWTHYNYHGKNEGRIWPICGNTNNITSSQSQNFIPENCESARKEYLDKNPDVKNVGMDPWTHYNYHGKNEGRVWPECKDKEIKSLDNAITSDDIKILTGVNENQSSSTLTNSQSTNIGNKGAQNGFGVYEFVNGDVYRGNFVNGKKEGIGEHYYIDGDVYKGDFVNNKYHGRGKYYFSNGDIKDALWENGVSTKQISYEFASKKKIGCISGNCQNGRGKYIFKNAVYEGDFINGKIHGEGKMIYSNGDIYIGQFSNAQRSGYGSYIHANGKKYNGDWLNNKWEGFGDFYFLDGRHYEGSFADGEISGQGTMHFPNGDVYFGSFLKNQFHGAGFYHYSNGMEKIGIWENGYFKEALNNTSTIVDNGQTNNSKSQKNESVQSEDDELRKAISSYILGGVKEGINQGINNWEKVVKGEGCSYCMASGECKTCRGHQYKYNFSSGVCSNYTWETNTGYVVCSKCRGSNFTLEKGNLCNCSNFCKGIACNNSACKNGWVNCPDCNSGLPGTQIGKCKYCNGTGKTH